MRDAVCWRGKVNGERKLWMIGNLHDQSAKVTDSGITKHYKNWFFTSYDLNANKTETEDVKDVKEYQHEQIRFNKKENSVDFRI
jgi:hypothetical protein